MSASVSSSSSSVVIAGRRAATVSTNSATTARHRAASASRKAGCAVTCAGRCTELATMCARAAGRGRPRRVRASGGMAHRPDERSCDKHSLPVVERGSGGCGVADVCLEAVRAHPRSGIAGPHAALAGSRSSATGTPSTSARSWITCAGGLASPRSHRATLPAVRCVAMASASSGFPAAMRSSRRRSPDRARDWARVAGRGIVLLESCRQMDCHLGGWRTAGVTHLQFERA